MYFLAGVIGGLLAAGWAAVSTDYVRGVRSGRALADMPAFATDAAAPPVSLVVAACNEAEKIEPAFRSLLAQNYPGPLEIVIVNDRSTDATGPILDRIKTDAPSGKDVVVLHNTHLPPGWLGKTHALFIGARHAQGKWLLFTDADVRFAPDTLSRAVRYADENNRQHLVAFFRLDLRGFWENVFGLGFAFLFNMRFRPWHVVNPNRPEYLGVGGFNLVRRDAYQAIGTHRAIALEVADDMELGHRLKQAGFRSEVIAAGDRITVRWQDGGLIGLMNGLTKNAYAGLDYSPTVLARSVVLLLATMVLPAVGLIFARGRARLGYGLAFLQHTLLGAHQATNGGIPAGYALTLPISSLLLIVVMLRSAWITERNQGITWRGTFYPLEMLRRPAVLLPPLGGAEETG